jgi:hypothetical protein
MMFQELIDKGLVKQKRYDNGLSVFKYTREVFYRSLWNEDPLLLEARGMVLDDEGNKVIWPFTKVFNHHENGTELDLDTPVVCPRKVNGYMASCTWYRGELVISTTGTLDSDYAVMARRYIEALETENIQFGYTYLFEICSPEDPHIVEEEEGAYLIGMRHMKLGVMFGEAFLDHEAMVIGAKRPETFRGTFREVLALLAECKHEGYMVINAKTRETVMKLKSPHYLSKKFLMRMGQKKVDVMFDNKEEFLKTIDEEFFEIVHYITHWFDKETWKQTNETARRKLIEDYFGDFE